MFSVVCSPRSSFVVVLCLTTLLLIRCSSSDERHPVTVDELCIRVSDGSREIAYTNKQAGFYYTETNATHRSAWQGWNIMATEVMEDYRFAVDGHELKREDALIVEVYPHQLRRLYRNDIREMVTMLDSVDAIVVQLSGVKGRTISVRPFFSDSDDSDDFTVRFEHNVLLVSSRHRQERVFPSNVPLWVGLTVRVPEDLQEVVGEPAVGDRGVSPAGVQAYLPGSEAIIVFVAGDTEEATIDRARWVLANADMLLEQRRARIDNLLNRAFVRTNDRRFDKAVHWAMASMDALIMNQRGKGIFAGLPWFNNYWGRDSFIALPGATLVTGNFSEAREILQSFADWQETDESSPNFGRIPNVVNPTSLHYNTADGTPWFVISLLEYFKYSGDTLFVGKLFPVVCRSIEGTLTYHADEFGFLTHGDAETWMDAVGPDGPWTPRGNRANDVQALWYKQLMAGAEIAQGTRNPTHAARWRQIAELLKRNFNERFVDRQRGVLYDHLTPDGKADAKLRPNQLFALELVDDPSLRWQVFKTVTEKLVYRHGIASLSQEDEDFHPYHHYEPFYVQDAAYHQGIVWTWLAGQWIDIATRYSASDPAFELTDNMVHQILERGGVGTLSELLDAAPRPNEDKSRLSGTFTQAWSLAEFLRVFYQSYLGVRVDARVPKLVLAPRLPTALTHADFRVRVKDFWVEVNYRRRKDGFEVTVSSTQRHSPLEVELHSSSLAGHQHVYRLVLESHGEKQLVFDNLGIWKDGENNKVEPLPPSAISSVNAAFRSDLKLAEPVLRPDLKTLRPPPYRILTNAEIKVENPRATVLYDVEDQEGDDRGPTGSYTYPRTPHLKAGSLDITRFTVSADEKNIYFKLTFRNLSNPGWHPEYGFQLTYAAIAIDQDRIRGSGEQNVGMNANYTLPAEHAFERIVYVGGGIRVADAHAKILAEYRPLPGDEQNPLGSVSQRTIEFALPLELLGQPSPVWQFAVLIGAQDDHGGAGLGDFRSIEAVAGEWVGGGKERRDGPNVYDVILPRVDTR